MRSRVNSVSVWFTSAMFTNAPFAVAGSISIWSWTVWAGGMGFSDMATAWQETPAAGTRGDA